MTQPCDPPLDQLADDLDELDGCACGSAHGPIRTFHATPNPYPYEQLVADEDLESYLVPLEGE